MATKVEKKQLKQKSISYDLDFIGTNRFYENHLDLEKEKVKKGKCNIGFGLNVDSKQGRLSFPIKVEFFPNTGENVPLFGIETVHSFTIKDFQNHLKKDENGKFHIPDGLIERLLGLAISGTRGMLVASVNLPEYKKVFLPLVDISRLLKLMKEDPDYGKEETETQ